jgi:photosystem II stability/assembly factor-like uncharacterized protein
MMNSLLSLCMMYFSPVDSLWRLLIRLPLYFFILFFFSGCEKTQPLVLSTSATTNSIQNLTVLNTSFFAHLQINNQLLIASGDGKIISSQQTFTQWSALQTPPATNKIIGLASDNTGQHLLAYGNDGFILVSNNAGKDWRLNKTETSNSLNTAAFNETTRQWRIAGQAGSIIESDADGNNWTNAPFASSKTIIKLLPTEAGDIAIGEDGLLAFQKKNSRDWQLLEHQLDESFTDIIATNSDRYILSTTNGKILILDISSQKIEIIDTGYSGYVSKLLFNQQHQTLIATTANGDILLSDDGGKLWAPVAIGKPYLSALASSKNGTYVFVAGDDGCILLSDNGGRTWRTLTLPTAANLEGIVNTFDMQWVAYGEHGALFTSDDNGENWSAVNRPINDFIHQLTQDISGTWYGAGVKGLVIESSNHGSGWTLTEARTQESDYFLSIITDKQSGNLIAAGPPGTILSKQPNQTHWLQPLGLNDASQGYFHQLISNDKGIIVAVAGPGAVYFSEDAGNNWHPAKDQTSQQLFAGHYDANRELFFTVGQSGTINSSQDGQHWHTLNSQTSESLQCILATTFGIFAAGNHGTIVRSFDGIQWQLSETPTASTLLTLFSTQQKTLIATGHNGTLLRSSDQGQNWLKIEVPTDTSLRMPVQDQQTGIIYIPGKNGDILYSYDDGLNWSLLPPVAKASLKSLAIDKQTGFLLGAGERLIRTPLLSKPQHLDSE